MIKILSAAQTRDADAYTIAHEPISSLDLMERASRVFSQWVLSRFPRKHPVYIFCGLGNNGGDGLAIGRMLSGYSYHVRLFTLDFKGKGSPDFMKNRKRYNGNVQNIAEPVDFPPIPSDALIIDALFGTGLNRPLEGLAQDVVEMLNEASAHAKLSIDIASGLFADRAATGSIFRPSHTVSFQLPKLAFMAAGQHRYVGEWHCPDIGLHPSFLGKCTTAHYYISDTAAKSLLKKRDKFSHKGIFGHLLLVAGSKGKAGAALLAAKAALRSGAGLLTAHLPASLVDIMQVQVPEAMVVCDRHEYVVSQIRAGEEYGAIVAGPGLGQSEESYLALKGLLLENRKKMVLDADALNIMAAHPELLESLPPGSMLTPHPKEFERLFGGTNDSFRQWDVQKEMAKRYQVCIILKGAHTSIADTEGNLYFNSSGNPGMATGGSGDVLSGICGALLAQGYPVMDAAISAVWHHGHAADAAVLEKGQTALLPTDIIDALRWD